MLHDPGSYTPPVILDEIRLTETEKIVLKKLGEEISKISALPIHREKAQLWTALNDLKPVRPMVWINEIPWHEMNVRDELTLQTINPWAREFEQKLRREIYQWKHMPGDMIVNAAVERMTDAWIRELDQFVEKNLLSLDNNNTRIGSGGYGYTSDLPGNGFDPTWIKPHNMWGCSNAQILVQVSSDMHWEFALNRSGNLLLNYCPPAEG